MKHSMKVKQEGSLSLAHLHGEQSFTTLLANFLSFFSQVEKLFLLRAQYIL